MGTDAPNLMPPSLAFVDPWYGEAAADNRWVTLAGDDNLPEMLIGRLPGNNPEEIGTMVSKILAYEGNTDTSWHGNVIFYTDNPDSAGDFVLLSDGVADSYLPPPFVANKIYLGETCDYQNPSVVCRDQFLNAVNTAGALIVNYVGHAGRTAWASERLLHLDMLPSLSNGEKTPIHLAMTCNDGYYHYPGDAAAQSLGEVAVRIDGRGAVASWSPSGLGLATGHDSLDQGFFNSVFFDDIRVLGEATLAGKLRLYATGANRDLIDTYHIFGDPALHINALDPELHIQKTVEPPGQVDPGDVLTYTLTFSNTGDATAHHVVLEDLLDPLLVNSTLIYTSPEVLGLRPGVTYGWDIEDLEPGDRGEIRFRAVVSPTTGPAAIVNEAEIYSPASRDIVSVTTGVQVPDMYVTKTGPDEPVTFNEAVTYTISWGNMGRAAAPDARLTDRLPPGVDYVADSSGWPHSEPSPGTIVWELGPNPVPTGTQQTFVVTGWITMDPRLTKWMTNSVFIKSAMPDADPFNDKDTAATQVLLPDLSVIVSGPPVATSWSEISYTVAYSNVGDVAAVNAVISDVLPAGAVYVRDDSGFARDEPVPGIHVWPISPAELQPGGRGAFTVVVQLGSLAETGPEVTNVVEIGANSPDPVPDNDVDHWITEVIGRYLYYLPRILLGSK
jgi:uncharacterized repeat protein (TIGR01451 family)